MIRLTIIFFLLTFASYGQPNKDYMLYSKVIDSFINVGIKLNVSTTEAIVLKKYTPPKNEISSFVNILQDTNEQRVLMALAYDQLKIRLIKDTLIKNAILSLESIFFETPVLDENEFNLSCKTKSITQEQFQNLFKDNKKKEIDKGWKKFYKMFPGAHGIFKFSKIIYSGNYACFYASRTSGGLSGRGDLVLMKKANDTWFIVTYFNLWMS